MKKNPRNKVTKVEVFEKKNLYYDVKAEKQKKLSNKEYEKKFLKLAVELVKLQEWVKANKLRVVVIFEGRDAAGKGGVIKTIAGSLNPKDMQDRCIGNPYGKRKNSMVFSEICFRTSFRGRDSSF